MHRNPRGISRIVGLAIGVAAVTLTLLLLVLLTWARLSAYAGYNGPQAFDSVGRASFADWRVVSAYHTIRGDARTAPMAATGNAVGAGLVSGAAKSLTNFATAANNAPASDADNITLAIPLARNLVFLKGAVVYRYYRPVAVVMAVFGIVAIVAGCIALWRRRTAHSDDG